jgi:hypothetical protein
MELNGEIVTEVFGTIHLLNHFGKLFKNYGYVNYSFDPIFHKYASILQVFGNELYSIDGTLSYGFNLKYNCDKFYEPVFIKPDNCLKVCEAFCKDDDEYRVIDYENSYPNSLFWLFPQAKISDEYRFFVDVANKTIIDGSTYIKNFIIDSTTKPEQDAYEYLIGVLERVNLLSICDEVITIDVCKSESSFYIMEANCFSTSGWYDSHSPEIILPYLKNVIWGNREF